MAPMFLEGVPKGYCETFGRFLHDLIVRLRSDILIVCHYYFQVPDCLTACLADFLGIMVFPWFLSGKVSKVFGGTASRGSATSLEVLSLPSCVVCLQLRISPQDLFPPL